MREEDTLRAAILCEAKRWLKPIREDLMKEPPPDPPPSAIGALSISAGSFEPWSGDGSTETSIILDKKTALILLDHLPTIINDELVSLGVEI